MMKKTLYTLLLVLITVGTTRAAKPGPYGFWPGYFGHAAINSRLGVWLEAQPRMYDFSGDLEQLLVRTAVTYKLNAEVQVAQGYGYIRSEPYIAGTEDKRVTEEHRIYQQLISRQRWQRVYLQHRYRAEERFLADQQFRMRFRYMLGANICLNDKEQKAGTLYLSLYNELFLHTDKPVFDRNRLFGGVGYGLSPTLRIEAGHLWQMQEAATRQQLQVMLFHNFKL